jgi:hypothetical protein
MKKVSCIIALIICFCVNCFAQAREEFNGPFASWANVKTRFKAKGDGISDDTKALQMAIDSLSVITLGFNKEPATAYTSIYIPKGHYKITQTLNLRGKIGINIIGEDPENTIIDWAGNDNDTMLLCNGSAYYKIARLTFNGNGKKQMEGLGIHWLQKWNEPKSRSYASLNIEVADCIFAGSLSVGIGGGFNWNDSEIKINRCTFNRCATAGVQIRGYNALDYWLWSCKFYNCNIAISTRNGNFHAYNCYFRQSEVSDVIGDNGYYTSMRGCFSDDSEALYCDNGISSNPFKRTFQDNIVKTPHGIPLHYRHAGKLTFINNQFDEVQPKDLVATKPTIYSITGKPYVAFWASWFNTNYDVLSISNSFFYKQPFLIAHQFPQKVYSINDSYNKRVSANGADFVNKMPATPAFTKRKVFEVPPKADDKIIQDIINQASKLSGQRPIVHFPVGQYFIRQTLVIPQGSDMQIVGDGYIYASMLLMQKPFTGTSLIKVKGPSYVEIRDLHIGVGPDKSAGGIEFENVDQQSSSVHIDQLYSLADTSLFVNGLNYTAFEKNNSFFSDGNVIVGGAKQKAGKGTLRVNCFGGAFKGASVSNGGVFVAKDCWWEGATRVPLDLQGDGNITIDGAMIAPNKADSLPSIKIGRFNGQLSFLNMYIQGGVAFNDPTNSSLKVLFWNINFYHKMDILSAIPNGIKGQVAFVGVNAQCFDNKNPLCKDVQTVADKFVNVSDENKYFDLMTMQDRGAQPSEYRKLPANTSNIYIGRVTLDGCRVGLKF